MRISFVFNGLQIGGVERVGIEYIKLLRERGYSISVINLMPGLNAMEKEIPADIPVTHIYFPRWMSPQRYSKLKRMFGLFGEISFYCFYLFFSLVAGVYCLFLKRKVSPADIVIAFSGNYNDLTFVTKVYERSVKKIAWIHGCQYSFDRIAPGYFRLYKKIRNLVCLSELNDEKVTRFNIENGINKIKLYNPINMEDWTVDYEKVLSLRARYGDFMIMVGRLAWDKDQTTLIKALGVLKDVYHLDKYLVLVGDGAERKRLEKLSSELGLSERVIFTGSVYDVQNYYLSSFLYVHSSPAEGLPTVILEAMYYGLPVVTTDSQPGVREILHGNEYGLISPVGDERALAANIFKMYSDKALREGYIEKEKERMKDFLPQNIIERFESYIADLQ